MCLHATHSWLVSAAVKGSATTSVRSVPLRMLVRSVCLKTQTVL